MPPRGRTQNSERSPRRPASPTSTSTSTPAKSSSRPRNRAWSSAATARRSRNHANVGWTPEVVRTPPIESSTVSNVRNYLKQEREERRDILQRVGRQINRRTTSDEDGFDSPRSAAVVGRARRLLPLDAGVPQPTASRPPRREGEIPFSRLPNAAAGPNARDAVVLTHAHLDHSALIPILFKYGYDGPIYTTAPTRDLMGLLQLDYLDVASKKGGHRPTRASRSGTH